MYEIIGFFSLIHFRLDMHMLVFWYYFKICCKR